uniref:Uncharacterized protein n=1 Tax=Kalanchoe fedtschenkoi TaxID=63787 RepID=A0A7N1A8W6_KALFE
MATIYQNAILCFLLATSAVLSAAPAAAIGRALASLVRQQPLILKYHKGPLLKGEITLNFVWVGNFSAAQRAIILDFLQSLNSNPQKPFKPPSAATWWKTTENYATGATKVKLGRHVFKRGYGKTLLTERHLVALSSGVGDGKSITVVLTDRDVLVDGFCRFCGTHGTTSGKQGRVRVPYIWVGNSETQCPGTCAWPFHQPLMGPQDPPLVAPNGDVGVDGMVINLATLLAGTVTNPFDDGYFMGPPTAPLEAVSACTGIFGSGAYPGYPGKTLVDESSGASYNANGVTGRRFLLPAMWDPRKLACSTLV